MPETAAQPEQELDVVEALRKDIESMLKERVDGEVSQEKQRQFARLDKADKYNRGITFLVPEFEGGVLSSWNAVAPGSVSERDLEAQGVYDYNFDAVKGYGRKFIAVLGTRPFYNLKAQPEDPASEEDRKAARMWDLAWIWLRNKLDIRIKNIEVFFKQWKAGNVYAYQDFVADKELFGTYDEPRYEPKSVEVEPAGFSCPNCLAKFPAPVMDDLGGASCPQCGGPIQEYDYQEAVTADVPELVEYVPYPNGGPRITLCTGYTVTLAPDATTLETAPYIRYEYEEHRGVLLQHLGDKLRKHLDENGELRGSHSSDTTQQGIQYRNAAASISGSVTSTQKKNRWTYTRDWIDTSMYEYFKDEEKRELAYAQFPEGMKVTRVDGLVVDIENKNKRENWAVFEPEPGDYLYKDPMCWGILGHQDAKNDAGNLLIATLERVPPSMVADPDMVDEDAINSRTMANEIIFAKPGTGGRLSDAFAKIPAADFPNEAYGLLDMIEQNIQQHTGLLPAAWGGGAGNKTAEQARNDLNQALMQLSVPGEYAGRGWKDVATKCVTLIAKYGTRNMSVPVAGGRSAEILDIETMRAGRAYFETDPGIPQSWSERREQLNHIIGQNPEMGHAMGLDSPDNAAVMRDYLLPGMVELHVPDEEIKDYTYEIIRELTEQEPIQDGPEPMPSVAPEPFVDHAKVADIAYRWLIDKPGRKAKVENPAGYANVVAWATAHSMMAMPPAPVDPETGEPMPPPEELPPPDQQQAA